jgi:hypothetical protein
MITQDADLQLRLDATVRELELTKAMLRLAELRLNAALGMPAKQIARIVRDIDAVPGPLPVEQNGVPA